MEIKATCQMCGKPYIKKNGKSMFCSDACKKARIKQRYEAEKEKRRIYQKKWYEEHKEEATERFKERHPNYQRDRYRVLRGSQEYTRTCVVCGKEFTTWLPQKKTCSEECKATWGKERDKRRKRDSKKDEERERERQHKRWINNRYGSEEAYQKYLQEKQESKERKLAENQAKKEANRRISNCIVCGREFETYNPKQKTCCKTCGRKLSNARKQKRIPEQQIIDKDITLESLYRRDSGVCYLCGGECDWNDKNGNVVGSLYPTIDHIVPVSRGGLHAWDNVRLAHFKCNVQKSNDIIPQAEKLIPKNAYSCKRILREQKKITVQYTVDGIFVAEYESTAEAERLTGIKQRGIQNCARGETKTYCGYVWRYKAG